jgi:hypothetical protein
MPGRAGDAALQLREALKIRPDDERARRMLGRMEGSP